MCGTPVWRRVAEVGSRRNDLRSATLTDWPSHGCAWGKSETKKARGDTEDAYDLRYGYLIRLHVNVNDLI